MGDCLKLGVAFCLNLVDGMGCCPNMPAINLPWGPVTDGPVVEYTYPSIFVPRSEA
jgi:hypothetical protein